ncbi:hypothetical protein LXA43DRAFT_1085637 [Ganoderma leucocontextum]|nr:hypothetical protein LXA43DRAFT_1085637 [Ganoderma leucocontextum]
MLRTDGGSADLEFWLRVEDGNIVLVAGKRAFKIYLYRGLSLAIHSPIFADCHCQSRCRPTQRRKPWHSFVRLGGGFETFPTRSNFTVTFCDLWGTLAYHFLPGTTPDSFTVQHPDRGGPCRVLNIFSSESTTKPTSWQNIELPFPLVVVNVNLPNVRGTPSGGNGSVSLETVVYGLSPLELAQLCDFTPLNGTKSPDSWTGPQALGGLVNQMFDGRDERPGPFLRPEGGTYQDSKETTLALFDGSLDDQNDPLFPLLVEGTEKAPAVQGTNLGGRAQSGETSDFKPNGQSLLATKTKVEMLPRGFMNFPTPFPNSTEEFVSLGLNTRPVFFGCDAASNDSQHFPLLVWIPNNDPGNITNFATSTLQLSTANQSVIFDRSYALASRGYVSDTDASLTQADAQCNTRRPGDEVQDGARL